MNLKKVLNTTLLVAAGMIMGATSAWGETIATMGSVDNASGSKVYTLAPNKTLTLTFTVNSTKGENETQGYTIELRHTGDANPKMFVQPGGGFYYWGDEWWNMSHMIKNDRSWDLADFKTLIQGATVELTIKRIHTQVLYYADITTASSLRHYLRLLSKEATFTENADLQVTLGADHAVLTEITDIVTDETITGTLIGKEDNSVDFNGEGAVNQAFTLEPDKSLELNFINYSSKIGNGDNWMLEIQNGGKYLDLKADYSGWDAWLPTDDHYYYRTLETTSPGYFTLESTSGDYWKDFPKALHKANVKLTVARSASTITITAIQTCLSGEVKTQTYTLTHSDFASGAITVRLYASWSHLDLLPVTKEITSTGWATYCSPYALNLAAAKGLTDAYIVTGGAAGVLEKTSVKDKAVPANTGLLLKGDAGTVTIPIVGSADASNAAGNKLVGVTAATPIAAGAGWVLMNDATNGLGFYKNKNAFTVGANTAYLPVGFDGAGAPAFFSLEGNTTAIETVKAQKVENGEYYNLAGQRVAQPTKGLYIVNGKKVIVK